MRRFAASIVVFAMSLTGAPVFAAGPARTARPAASAAGISTAVIIGTVAAAAGVVGIVVAVNRSNASPSR